MSRTELYNKGHVIQPVKGYDVEQFWLTEQAITIKMAKRYAVFNIIIFKHTYYYTDEIRTLWELGDAVWPKT